MRRDWNDPEAIAYPIASGNLGVGENINAAGGFPTFVPTRLNAPWTNTAGLLTFNGQPDHVLIIASVYWDEPVSNAKARVSPVLELLNNGILVDAADTGYTRHTTGDGGGSNRIVFLDDSPTLNPNYRIRTNQGSTQNDVIIATLGRLSLKAF